MKVLVLSDSHGNYSKMKELFEKDSYRAVIFLGDGLREAENLYRISGAVPVYRVAGNCDFTFGEMVFTEQIIELAGKRIFITHGHSYSVKSTPARLVERAKQAGCELALYGHTHIPKIEEREGVTLANPGALAGGCYAVMTIDKKISIELMEM